MIRLGTKLALFNLISKLLFTAVFLACLPAIVNRINILQTDTELVKKREKVLDLITKIGIEPFMTDDSLDAFGSYNILKEEFISIERAELSEDWNFIEVSPRLIDNEKIDYRVLNYSFKIEDQTYLLEIGKSLSSILYTQKNIRSIILIFLSLIIIITLLSDLYFNRRVLMPLKLIINKLSSTSTPSYYDRIPVRTTTSDFSQLDSTLTELMNKIDELFNKEKEITVNISHELLTPVSVLRSKLENLLLKKDIDDFTAEKIEESLRTLHRLKTLINSLLLISKIESQQYIKSDSVNMTELITEISDELSPMAVDKGIILNISNNSEILFQDANRTLIFSMIYNVVNNAIRNTSKGGSITIETSKTDGKAILKIIDTGIGMNEEELGNLFLRFRKKLDSGSDSNGIGLAITKSIADFHNISVSVISNPGEGTSFFFIFPENS